MSKEIIFKLGLMFGRNCWERIVLNSSLILSVYEVPTDDSIGHRQNSSDTE